MKILVELPKDRSILGTLRLFDDGGGEVFRCECLGKADQEAATAHGNPTRDWRLPFGDTPLGEFNVIHDAISPTEANVYSFGTAYAEARFPASSENSSIRVFDLYSTEWEHKRPGLMIHGGTLNAAFTFWNGLRPTHGCLRLSNADIDRLIGLIPMSATVIIAEV